jgi:hypothetical protein
VEFELNALLRLRSGDWWSWTRRARVLVVADATSGSPHRMHAPLAEDQRPGRGEETGESESEMGDAGMVR